MTKDRRFSSLKGESRKWLDPEDFDLDSDLAEDELAPQQDPQSSLVSRPLDQTIALSKPLVRLGDMVSL